MLTVHHLGRSQSERVVWLCEALGIPYILKRYDRLASFRAPPEYQALHPLGQAPVITNDDVVLAESGAVVQYIVETYGDGDLRVAPGEAGYTDYLYWLHFANGTLQPLVTRNMIAKRMFPSSDHPAVAPAIERFALILGMLDQQLGKADYLAGDALTLADIMTVFSLTTMRVFDPYDLSPYPNILAYLQRIGGMESYRRAMAKGEPDMAPLLS